MVKDIIAQCAKEHFGIESLYPQQRIVIANILSAAGFYGEEEAEDAPKHQLVILPTGMGKSICFMLPCLLMKPLTLVVFPLLSLMSDQKRRFDNAGIPVVLIRGGQSREERQKIFRSIEQEKVAAILTNPEMLESQRLMELLSTVERIHLVVDEVHTLPEWGESFRPALLKIGGLAERLPITQITAFTATAGERIIEGVTRLLFHGDSPNLVTALPDRPNIHYRVIPSLNKSADIAALLADGMGKTENHRGEAPTPFVSPMPRPAVIFCRTRKETERVARELRYKLEEDSIRFYHAGLEREEKELCADWFFTSIRGILVATTAYGMGVDKANIRTVIHHRPSPSVEAFLQESGRAGRDRKPAWSVVLLSPDDLHPDHGDQRYEALLACFTDANRCRREALLKLLDAQIKECGGCDVCDSSVQQEARGRRELLTLFRAMPLRWKEKEGATMAAIRFPNITTEEAHSLITALFAEGSLKKVSRGPWKGLIYPAGFPVSIFRTDPYRSAARGRSPLPQPR